MKRKLLFALITSIMVISCAIGFSACDFGDDTHEHIFSDKWASNETHHWHECDCDEISDKTEHIWNNGVITTKPTCTETGKILYTCTVCNSTKTETLEVIEHTFTDWQSENTEHVRTCSFCGKEQREQHIYENNTCKICGKLSIFEYNDVTVSLDWYNSNEQKYYIYDLYDFNGIAFLVNNNIDSFEDKTIFFGSDLDFGVGDYLPVGTMAFINYEDTDFAFRGVLKGNGYKILNYTVSDENIHTVFYPYSKAPLYITSLFLKNYGRIEDIIIDNFTIDTSITEDYSNIQNTFKFSVLTVENHGEILNCSLTGNINCFIQADQPFSDISVLFNSNYGYISDCQVNCSAEIHRNTSCVSYSQFGSYNYGRIEESTASGNIYYTNADSVYSGSYSGFVINSNFSIADNIYYNSYDNWASIYGEQGLYSCESRANIYSSTYNRDTVCGIAASSTSTISSCKYSGKIDISANSNTVFIDGNISGIVGGINNSPYSKSIISDCEMTGEIDIVVNQINDDGYLRTLAIAGIIGEIQTAREKTIIDNNVFSGSIKITDNTTGNPTGDNVMYYLAGIVGKAMLHWSYENPPSQTIITNCRMTGNIEAKTSHITVIGGITGYMYRNNELEGTVGDDFTLNLSSCSFNGHITVKDCRSTIIGVGGIVGQIMSVNISNSNANGKFDIINSKGTFFGTIVGQSTNALSFENGYTMSEIINCEGHIQAVIDGVTYNCSNLFGHSEWSYIKNKKIATELATKYYYNTLDVNSKALYEEIYTWFVEIGRYPYTLFAPIPAIGPIDYGKYNLSAEDFNEIFIMVKLDSPQFYYIENMFYTYENNGESVPYAEPKIWDRYLTQEISSDQVKLHNILESISEATSNLSEQEKIKYIYDYIKANTVYTQYDEYTSTIIGSLLNGNAVCEGYSLSFKYLCDYIGINCIVVVSDEMDHAWNIVEIDGAWYYVDTTWADTGTKEYFLLGSNEFNLDHYTFNDYLKIPEVSITNYNLI